MNTKSNINIRKFFFSLIIGGCSFFVIYFIFDKILPPENIKKVEITYKDEPDQAINVFLKYRQQPKSCELIAEDTLTEDIRTKTYAIEGLTPYQKLEIVFDRKNTEATIYSVVFYFKNRSLTWNKRKLINNFYTDGKIKTKPGVSYVTIFDDYSDFSVRTIAPLFNIIEQHEFVKAALLSLILSGVLVLLFLFVPVKIQVSLKEMLLVSLFLCLISSSLLINYKSYTNFEKRTLSKKPELKTNRIRSYHRDYGKYFADNFGFRSLLIKANNHIKYKLFKISPVPQKVIIGQYDWLYQSDNISMDIAQNRSFYNNEELEKIKNNLERKKEWITNQGMALYILVPPIKAHVYPEFFPPHYNRVHQQSKLDQLKVYLDKNSTINLIDPTEALIKGKKIHKTYYTNDTHWTVFGALIGYNELLAEIKKDFPQIKLLNLNNLAYKKVKKEGNLGKMVGISKFVVSEEQKPVLDSSIKINKKINPKLLDKDFLQPAQLIEYTNPEGLNILIFRDSFSSYYLDYLGIVFKRGLFLWTHNFKPAIIKKEKPDIVVYEVYERYLDNLLQEEEN